MRGLKFGTCFGLVLAGVTISHTASAQIGGLLGSPHGTYCKVKKGDVIRAKTNLPLDFSAIYARQMTLRRLASLARSKGFAAFVITQENCGTWLVNDSPRWRECDMTARMENSLEPPSASEADKWFSVDAVLRATQDDALNYPVTQGIMNRGNKCVID